MNKQSLLKTKPLASLIFRAALGSGVLAGCLSALIIISSGRAWLDVTSSSLTGWTSLCFLAIFSGLFIANHLCEFPFITKIQAIGLILGSASSLAALLLLQSELDLASNTMLVISVLLFFPCLFGFKTRQDVKKSRQEQTLLHWALRLDVLMKYKLSPNARASLSHLIDSVWQSPPDPSDFIPAENVEFEHMLDALELTVKTNGLDSIDLIVSELNECLQTRNLLLSKLLSIEYQKIEVDRPVIPKKVVRNGNEAI